MKRSTKDKNSEQKEGSHSNGTESPNSDTDSEVSQRLPIIPTTDTNNQIIAQFNNETTDQDNEVLIIYNHTPTLYERR